MQEKKKKKNWSAAVLLDVNTAAIREVRRHQAVHP